MEICIISDKNAHSLVDQETVVKITAEIEAEKEAAEAAKKKV